MTAVLHIADRTPDAQSSAASVELLRRLLVKAEAGEIVGLACVWVDRTRNIDTEATACGYWPELYYGLALLQDEMRAADTPEPGNG